MTTTLPARLLIGGDHKTADEHTRTAEELLGAAATLLHGGTSRKRLAQATALAELGQGHAILAAVKNGINPRQP